MDSLPEIKLDDIRLVPTWGTAPLGTLLQVGTSDPADPRAVIGMRCDLRGPGGSALPFLLTLSGRDMGSLVAPEHYETDALDISALIDIVAVDPVARVIPMPGEIGTL